MKRVAGILLILLIGISGCIEGKLTAIEANECLLSTATQQSLIPSCETELECESNLSEHSPRKIFTALNVGAEEIMTRKKMSVAWKSITRASEAIDRLHASCSTMKIESIFPKAIEAASEIQGALKASEEVQRQTYQALEKTIRKAEEQQLIEIKDTEAYEAYADLVKKHREITTGNPVSEWGSQQQETINYFENIARTISGAKKNPYQITWSTLFDAYKTGVQIQVKDGARGIIALSPLWQGALVSLNGKKESSKALQLVGKIRANETLSHVERVVSPENGIITNIWTSIRRLEDEMLALEEDEKKWQNTTKSRAANLREKWEKSTENNSEWTEIEEEMNAWLKSTGRIVLRVETISENEVSTVEREMNELIYAGNEKTTSIGMRIKMWRKLERAIAQLEQKIDNVAKQNETRNEMCLEIMNKISAQKNSTEHVSCPEAFASMLSQNTLFLDEKNRVKENLMQECVEKLNQWERAIGVELTPREWFVYYGSVESEASCESAKTNAKWMYENSEHAKEMATQKKLLSEIRKILRLATADFPSEEENIQKNIQRITEAIDLVNPLTKEEWSNKLVEWNQLENEVESEATWYLQKISEHATWKLTNTEKIIIGKQINANVEGILFARAHEKIDFEFMVTIPNPGVTNAVANGDSRIIIDGDWISIEGESIPAGGVQWQGEGSVWGARATKEKAHVEAVGKMARVEQTATIVTDFYPIQGEWELKKVYDRGNVGWAESNDRIIFPENGKITLPLNEKETLARAVIEIPDAVRVETSNHSSVTLDEKTIVHYHVRVQNELMQQVAASIYTGINGDPQIIENVSATNENGEIVNVTLDAGGNVVLREQVLLARQARNYVIRVEKKSNNDETDTVVSRLMIEVEQLMQNDHETTAKAAQKIMNELIRVQNEKNLLKKEILLVKIQNDVSGLIIQAREKDEEWSYLVNEWEKIKIRSNELGLTNEWIAGGEDAIKNMDEQKLRSIIASVQQRQTKTEKAQIVFDGDEKLAIGTNVLAEVQKVVKEYEKGTKIGCEKLIQVNFVCPLTNEVMSQFKKEIGVYEKLVERMASKKEKLSVEKFAEEWALVESDWMRMQAKIGEISIELTKGVREMKNAAVERGNALKIEAERAGKEDVVEANDKAQQAVENGEYGKSIYISQNVLNYLNSSKITGFFTLPGEVWPLMGVIVLVGGWIGFNEWKKKKIVEVEWKKIPRAIIPDELNSETNANAPPATQEGFPKPIQTKAWTKNPMRRETSEKTEELVLRKGKNK